MSNNLSTEYVKLQKQYLELSEYAKELNKKLHHQRNLEIENLVQRGILIGYQHTTRSILEFALESQPGPAIDLKKASQDFFKEFFK